MKSPLSQHPPIPPPPRRARLLLMLIRELNIKESAKPDVKEREHKFATIPVIDWSRVIHDTKFNTVDRNISLGQFIKTYAQTHINK